MDVGNPSMALHMQVQGRLQRSTTAVRATDKDMCQHPARTLAHWGSMRLCCGQLLGTFVGQPSPTGGPR